MRVKLFCNIRGRNPNAVLFGVSWRNPLDLEDEINAWLLQNPKIKLVDIKQSASGGSFAPSQWLVSVWYEEAVETEISPERGGS